MSGESPCIYTTLPSPTSSSLSLSALLSYARPLVDPAPSMTTFDSTSTQFMNYGCSLLDTAMTSSFKSDLLYMTSGMGEGQKSIFDPLRFPPSLPPPPPLPSVEMTSLDIKPNKDCTSVVGPMRIPPPPMPFRQDQLCHVCRSAGATLHYGGLVCGGCKIFFARAVQKKMYYVCEKSGACRMVPGKRSKCRSCRFQQCLKARMCPEEVGKLRELKVPDGLLLAKEEGSIVPYFDHLTLQYTLVDQTYKMGVSFSERLKLTNGVKNIVQMYVNLERNCDNDTYCTRLPKRLRCSLDVSVADALRNPLSVCERAPCGWKLTASGPQKFGFGIDGDELHPEMFKMAYCRVTLHYLEWLTAIEDLYMFSEEDRLTLVSTRATSIVMLILAYNTYKHGSDGFLLGFGLVLRAETPNERPNPLLSLVVRTIQEKVVGRMKELQLTEEEYVLLKLVALFTISEPFRDDMTAGMARSLRCKYECLLTRLVDETHSSPSSSTSSSFDFGHLDSNKGSLVALRMAELLDIITTLMGLVEVPSTIFIDMVSRNLANMRGELSYDLHVREYNL